MYLNMLFMLENVSCEITNNAFYERSMRLISA